MDAIIGFECTTTRIRNERNRKESLHRRRAIEKETLRYSGLSLQVLLSAC